LSDYIAEFIINIWVSFLFLILANGKLNRRSFRYSYLLQILSVLVLAECALLLDVMQAPVIIKSLTILLVLHYLYTCIFFTFQISNLFWVVIFCIVETCFQIHSDHIPCRMAAHRCRWDADGLCSTKLGYDPVSSDPYGIDIHSALFLIQSLQALTNRKNNLRSVVSLMHRD